MRALERKKAIIDVLCSRRQESVDNLAFEFDVTRRTIIRDIEELSLSYPIYTMTGPTGGIFIDDNYRLRFRKLSTEQIRALEKAMATASIKDGATLNVNLPILFVWVHILAQIATIKTQCTIAISLRV